MTHSIVAPIGWFYTPMALEFARDLPYGLVIYDCVDELSAFQGAPPGLRELERELLQLSDLVFTGGRSLYEAKSQQHPRVHLFPSSVDAKHFGNARLAPSDPDDQRQIPHPRAGFFGVIDERMDVALLDRLATERPALQIVVLSPVVKIAESSLPRRPNLHYLGQESYDALPSYLGNWDIAFRAQRIDPVHQPDEDVGVPRGRKTRGIDADSRRSDALWRAEAGPRGWRSGLRRRGGCGTHRTISRAGGERRAEPHLLAKHLAAHVGADR